MPVIPVVSYLYTGLAGYSMSPGISRGACKLIRTPRVIYIKKKTSFFGEELLQMATGQMLKVVSCLGRTAYAFILMLSHISIVC